MLKQIATKQQVQRIYQIETFLRLIGGRWKPLVIYHLFHDGDSLRYSQLQRHIPTITPKMLTQQLRELERDGLVERKIHPEVPPRVEYKLSPLGSTLRPILRAMCDWAKNYQGHKPAQ